MRHAKRSLELQDDPAAETQLLTATLLISWAQLLMESTQKDLMIILQKSDYGKKYSPVEKFFDYLEELDEQISVAIRHQAAKDPAKGSGHQDD